MSKIITRLLVAGVALLLTFPSLSQSIAVLPATISLDPGERITVAVTVDDFFNISAFSGTVSWDSDHLEFVSVIPSSIQVPGMTPPNCGGPVCSFNDAFTDQGDLIFTWFDLGGNEFDFDNGDTLWMMEFDGVNAGMSDLSFTSDFAALTITVPDGMGSVTDVTPTVTPASITVNGSGGGPSGPTINVQPSSATLDPGDRITVAVTVEDFIDITTFSGTISWNPDQLSFVSVPTSSIQIPGMTPPNCGGPVCSFNDAFVNQGDLIFTWFDLGGNEFTFDGGDTLWMMEFDAVNVGVTDLTFNSDFAMLSITVPDGMGGTMDITPSANPGTYQIGNGSDPCALFGGDFGLYVVGDSAATGEQICVDINACNFNDLVSITYTLEFDPTVLQFDSLAFVNQPQLGAGNFNFNLVNTGRITHLWVDSMGTGVTYSSPEPLYSLCFTAIGPGGSVDTVRLSGDLTDLLASDTSLVEMPFPNEPGLIGVLGNSAAAMSVNVGSATVNEGESTCVDVTVQNFNDILSLEYTMAWDPTILSFDTILDPNNFFMGNPAASFDTSPALTDAGNLTLDWSSGTPQTRADDFVLYQVCYDAVGNPGDISDVQVTGDVTPIAATQSDGMGGSMSIPVNSTGGEIEILGAGIFTFNTTDATVCPGDTFCVYFESRAFTDLITMEYTLNWDPTLLTFESASFVELPIGGTQVGGFNVSQIATGRLGFTWTDISFAGFTFPDGDTLTQMCFIATGPDGSNVPFTFTDDVNETLIGNFGGPLPFQTAPGGVVISDGACSSAIDVTGVVTNVDCFGDSTGAIDISVAGGTPPYTYSWTGPGGFTSTDEDLTGLAAGTYDVTVSDGAGGMGMASFTVNESSEIVLSATNTPASCNGGTDGAIDLTVMGGTTPYTYSWDNGAGTNEDPTTLAAGTYCVTVTDALSCTATICETVNENAAFTLSATITDATCNGDSDGAIDLTVTGASSAPTFNWDNGAGTNEDPSGLAAGTYCVTITDSEGCTGTTCATVEEDDPFTLSATVTDVSCNGADDGSIDLTVTGSVGNLSYSWDNGAGSSEDPTGLAPGTYSVTVTDDNCSVSASYTVDEPTAIVLTPIPTNVTCNGDSDGSIDLTVMGGTAPYTYSWDNGAGTNEDPSGLSGATYCVTVTDARSCTQTTCVVVDEPAAIDITGVVTDQIVIGTSDGAIDITIQGGTTPYASTSWTGPGGFTSSDEDLTGLAPGTYDVTVVDANGCTQSASFTVDPAELPSVGGADITDANCNGEATGGIDLTITGGLPPYEFVWDNTPPSMTEDLVNVPAGTYSVTITDDNGTVITAGPYTVGEPQAISFTETHEDLTCNGVFEGEISLTISGGTAPYTVDWNQPMLSGPDLTDLAPGDYTPTITDANGCTLVGAPITISQPDAIDISVDQISPITCNGDGNGAIDITVSGGTPPYDVDWSNGAGTEDLSGLDAGTYTPTVTDANGCTFSIPGIEITEPAAILGNPVVTEISCNGDNNGAIDLSPTGGSGSYTFDWGIANTEDLTNLAPGSYSVTISDSDGCSVVEGPFTLTEPAPLNIDATLTTPGSSNDDGIINLAVTGGTAGYTFNWTGSGGFSSTNNPITGLGSGEYRVTVTDANGCSISDVYLLTGDLQANGQVTNASCNGGTDGGVQTFVQGGIGPYTYEWSNMTSLPDLLNVGAGTYTVTITDQTTNAVIIESYTVGEPMAIIISIIDVTGESGAGCNGSISINVTGGNAPYTYSWSNGASSKNITDLCKGDYTVAITDAQGCFVESDVITVDPAPITCSNIDVTNTSCADTQDGSATLTFFGGCPPYVVSLNNGATQTSLDGVLTFEDLSADDFVVNIIDNEGRAKSFSFTVASPPPLVINIDNIVPNTGETGSCNGFVNISVTGGVAPYSFTWSNGDTSEDLIDVCGNGSPYSVTVLDANGCVITMGGFVVNDLPSIAIYVSYQLDETCFEDCAGLISINPSGGVPHFSYTWSNGGGNTATLTDLCAGAYTVTVSDANGTTQEDTYIIGGASSILEIQDAIVTASQGAADNGSILLVVDGGVPPYTYEWSTGASTNPVIGLAAGPVNVVVIDGNGCIITAAYTIESNVISVAVESDPSECAASPGGGCVGVSPLTGVAPFNYLWSNGQSGAKICGLESGNYTVTITDANALTAVIEVPLVNPNPLEVTIEDLGSGSVRATVSGGTAPYLYSWNDNNNSQTALVDDLSPGAYGLLVTDDNGCLGEGTIDVRPEGECDDVRQVISPNGDGKNDAFLVVCAFEFTDNTLQVFDRYGKLVYRADNYDNTWEGTDLDSTILPEGGYFWVFEYRDAEEQLQTVKGHLTILR